MSTHYSERDIFPLSGGCACGLIRYRLNLPPIIVHACYCTGCQRQTGSVLALNAVIEPSAIEMLPSASPTVAGSPVSPEPVKAGVAPAFARITAAEDPMREPRPAADTVAVCLPSESGLGQTVVTCPTCHTGLWTHYADAGRNLYYVRVGTLDQPWQIEPDVHIYTRSRQAWVAANDGKPSFEEYYPDRRLLLREDALKRFEAMSPKAKEMWAELKPALGRN
ncbi:hypothetical protein BHE90_008170 [Fusarium euwallaceae]|uniref:CENP-V/GFA domain-containing protein n=1 Tax=Fusarium euwallaceae TaxID=1147111 RepID=A0A430LNS3_9HYPO|nr:hypothetical protein BHE90_008170 [Fusarium euwallaceae]